MTTVKLEPMDPDEYRQWFGEDLVRSALAADVSAPTPSAVRPCYVRLENLMLPPARRPELPGRGPQPSPRRTASRSPTPPGRSRSRARSRARPPRSSPSPPARPAADRGRVRSRSVAPPNGRIRDRSTKPRSLSCSRKQERDAELGAAPAASGTPRVVLGRPKSAGLNVVKCTLCLMPFTLQSSLKKHVQAHQACSPNRCLICGATMPDVAEAVQHFLSHPTYLPAGGVLMCQLCGKTFPRNKRSRLTQHVLLHTGEEPHRCATCKAGFRTTNLLRQHAKRLHGSSDAGVFKSAALVRSASFLCHSCPARRSSAKLLAEHLREAHGRGRDELTCYYCPKRLHSLDRLKEHLQRAHAADRPHACPRCPKRFHSRSHALRHQAIHSLAYKCSVCDQRFANTKLCLEHVGRAHPRAMEPAAVIARLSRNM